MKWQSWLILSMLTLPLAAQKDPFDLDKRQGFLEVVGPIITEGEREIYKSLPDHDSRRYFEAVFWHKRDNDPSTTTNPFRKGFFERRQLAGAQFGTPKIPGVDTDRGMMFLLLGPPDDAQETQVASAGLRPGREEVWTYEGIGTFRFVFDGLRPTYQLQEKEKWEPFFEKFRNELVLDRAEPYTLRELELTLPHLGFTKDIENLASEDKYELDFELTYTFFKGDANRTEVLVGFTPRDGSGRGMDINLSAYDPFGEKTREFKKLIETKNGRYEFFSLALEPDQYTMVLRVIDKDGREAIDRRLLDVPALRGLQTFASGILLAPELEDVPLYGFLHPKKLVYGTRYFPSRNDFSRFEGERIFANQLFHNFPDKPEVRWYVDHQEVTAKLEHEAEEPNLLRQVVSLPVAGLGPGVHEIKSVYADDVGNLVANVAQFTIAGSDGKLDPLSQATASDQVTIVHPSSTSVAEFDRVVARAPAGVQVERMYVYLNGALILEQSKSPWEVSVDQGLFSISGTNTVDVVLKTNKGLLKAQKVLEPLKIKERYGTRVVQIFFNAFNEDLKFLPDLNLDTLTVSVNGEEKPAREIKKVDEPITYCFLVDTSFSMKDSFSQNISALKKFIEGMRPQDRGYFVTFSNKYSQIMTPNQSKAVLVAVADSLKLDKPNPKQADRLYEENETYLYDAVIAAMHSQLQYSGRPVVLMVSDGVGIEGLYRRNGMLSYARENESVIYSLWLDNNPKLSDEEKNFLAREMSGGEKFARKIGLARFFSKKDARKVNISNKVRNESITQGVVKILAEESGGFHYRIFRDDRSLIKAYVSDIAEAVGNMYVASVTLPIAREDYEVKITSSDETVNIRNKSKVKVSKTNPLLD